MKNAVKIMSASLSALFLLCSCAGNTAQNVTDDITVTDQAYVSDSDISTSTDVVTDDTSSEDPGTATDVITYDITDEITDDITDEATDHITTDVVTDAVTEDTSTETDTESKGDENLKTFYNPISTVPMPDPYIIYHDGYYYGLATEAGQVRLHRSKTVENIFSFKDYKDLIKWTSDIGYGRILGANIWAPELHYIPSEGKWYIYSCACINTWGDFAEMRMFCLESEGSDPFGDYTYKGVTLDDTVAIDQTVYYDKTSGELYTAYSYFTDDKGQVLMIADMKNPWTVGETRSMVSYPQYYWERRGTNPENDGRVNEGPIFFEHNGQIYLIYSASGCWSEYYCLGMLHYIGPDTTKKNFLNPDNWEKSLEPIFKRGNDVYGVGHCNFFTSPDGTELWIAYHGMESRDSGVINRFAYIQKIDVDENGAPVIGDPVPRETAIRVPSGQK